MKNFKSKVLIGLGVAGLMASNASAALVAPTFDSTDAITIGTAVLTGLALIWGIKQAMKLAR